MKIDTSVRPKIKVEKSNLERIIEAVTLVAVIMMWVYLWLFWPSIPHRIPTHFGAMGQADAWGSKTTLIIPAIVTTVLYLSMAILAQSPQIYNYNSIKITEENAEAQYRNARTMMLWLNVQIVAIFFYIQWRTVDVAIGNSKGLGLWFLPLFLVVMFGTLGYYIVKMYKLK